MDILGNDHTEWAEAIASRITDEFISDNQGGIDGEDRNLFESELVKMLKLSPKSCRALIGTTIIEEGYFTDV